MPKQILLNALEMFTPAQVSHGMWRHPRDQAINYNDLHRWVDLAKTLERGLFDGMFIADVLGPYDVYGGSPDAAISTGSQLPVNDPALLVSAMAHGTTHLGFGITSNISYEHPYLLARRFSTLDHITNGRIAWNIVTGYLDSAARAMGLDAQRQHDARYDLADDYMAAVYKLWETSWEDDAVVRDRAAGIYAQPGKVHAVRHEGSGLRLDGIHLSEPSPQRTPVLYQAGASARGRMFAATHAEATFLSGKSRQVVRSIVDDIRAKAVLAGRDRQAIKMFLGVTVVVAETDALAEAKAADYAAYVSILGSLAQTSASIGIDLSQYPLDEPLKYQENNSNNSALEALTIKSADKVWTLRELMLNTGLGGRGLLIVGNPKKVADELQSWMIECDIDGFNVARTVSPEDMESFIELVVPELQRRGLYKTGYADGTLRQRLFPGRPARLQDDHISASYRRT